MIMDLNIKDREDEEVETKGDFDPDVASMRSKMAELEEELEEETPSIPFFKTPREIIDKFRTFEQRDEEMMKLSSDGKPMETDQGGESGDGTKIGNNGEGNSQGGANGGSKKTEDGKDKDDDMSIKSQV